MMIIKFVNPNIKQKTKKLIIIAFITNNYNLLILILKQNRKCVSNFNIILLLRFNLLKI